MAKKESLEREALEHMTPAKNNETGEKSVVINPNANKKPTYTRDERLNALQYIEVNKDIMLYKAKFYPSSWIFKCRAALGAEVAAFSTIDNEDPLSVNDGINELLKTCLRITDDKGSNISWTNLYEFDRMFFILFIRDLTMQSTEQKIVYSQRCEHCNEPNEVTLSFDNLIEMPETELAKRYWDESENAFMVTTRNYGVIKLQPSTLKRANIFKDYMIELARNNQQTPSRAFMNMFWMFLNSDNENSKDAAKNAYMQFIACSNDTKKFSIYAKLNKELQLGMTQEIKYKCEHCERECRGQITFPDGLSNLFIYTNLSEELL